MLKVLIGYDDQDDIELFGEALFGVSPCAKLIIATTGAEVLDRLKTAQPCIIFLDINMPDVRMLNGNG